MAEKLFVESEKGKDQDAFETDRSCVPTAAHYVRSSEEKSLSQRESRR